MLGANALSEAASNPAFWVPVLALALAAFVARRYTRWSALSARRSLALGTTQELRKLPNVKFELVDARGFIGGSTRKWVYQLVIQNRSETANSIVTIRLVVQYVDSDTSMNLVLSPSESAAAGLPLPFNIAGRSAQHGQVAFSISKAALGTRQIKSLRLRIHDVEGTVTEIPAETLSEQLGRDQDA